MQNIRQAIEQQHYQEAYDLLQSYIQPDHPYTDTIAILEASIYIGLGRFQEAMICIHSGLTFNPVNYELYYMMGIVYEACSQNNKAYLCYENALYHCTDHDEDYSAIEQCFRRFVNETNTTVPNVSIILLSFNHLQYTKGCVESIRAFCPVSCYEIICVDNASTDQTAEWLAAQPDITYQINEKNLGFAGGCNAGIRLSNPHNDIFLLNDDTVMTENALFWLRMGLYDKEDIGAAGAVSNNAPGQMISETRDSLDEYLKYGLTHNIPMDHPITYRTWLIGFALLIKRTAFDYTGFLDERFYPGNFEDNDYCTRLILNDYKLALCNNSFIFHFGNKGFSVLEERNESSLLSAFNVNHQRYIEKWHIRPAYSFFCRNELISRMNPEDQWRNIKCLDIGCACGGTLLGIRNYYPNASLYGIELDPHCAAFASHIATVAQGNIETMEFPFDVCFDYIIMGDILEHLVEPEKLLKKLRAHLSNPGGVIITSIPNILHYSAITQILRGSFEYADYGVLDRTHLRFFTKYNSARLLMDAGYEIIDFQKVELKPPKDSASINTFIDRLAEIPEVVDKEQFFISQYVYTARLKAVQ